MNHKQQAKADVISKRQRRPSLPCFLQPSYASFWPASWHCCALMLLLNSAEGSSLYHEGPSLLGRLLKWVLQLQHRTQALNAALLADVSISVHRYVCGIAGCAQ